MHFLIFALSYPLIWLLSRHPMRILYYFSDFFFFIFYYIIKYRRNVVTKNLQLAFPKKKLNELNQIQKQFFRHFTDLFFESMKTFTISEKTIRKRYRYKNPELVNQLYQQGKSVILMGAHQANWEWSLSIPLFVDMQCFGVYTRIGNPFFDKMIKKARVKFRFIGCETTESIQLIAHNASQKIQGLYLLLSDQSPQIHKAHYWRKFMGIDVPVHTGAEMIAKKYDMAVVNYSITKVKRGYFEIHFETITKQPKNYENYEITDRYIAITERNIRAQPEFYLWSHRRFKHKDKVPEKWKK